MTAVSEQRLTPTTDGVRSAERLRTAVAHVAVWLIGASVFFSQVLASGFTRLVGDQGDARLTVYLDEWWFSVLHGRGPWRTPPFFTPVSNTLGLTDTYLIDQVAYAPLRLLGADPFLAYQVTAIALTAVGFAGWSLMVQRLFDVRLPVRLLSSTLFAFSGGLALHGEHPQLFGIEVIPWIVVALCASWAAPTKKGQFALGGAAGLLALVEAASTFYVWYFAVLAAVAFALLRVALDPRGVWAAARLRLLSVPMAALGAVVGTVLGGALFASIYLPTFRAVGGYSRAMVLSYAPTPVDLVNLSSTDLLWGKVSTWVAGAAASNGGEVSYGSSPILLAVTVALIALVWLARRSVREVATPLCLLAVSLGGAVVAVRFGTFFAWDLVRWLPGASAIRAVGRIGLVANAVLLLACCAACAPNRWSWLTMPRRRPLIACAVAICTLLVMEQIHTSEPVYLSRPTELSVLAAVPQAPPTCRYFALESFGQTKRLVDVQTEAMMLSLRLGLPTVNGYSGSFPKGWNLFVTTSPSYRHAIATWAAARHLKGQGCIYNATTTQWSALVPIRRLNWPFFGV